VAAVTKSLYLELVNMLWHERISHEQLGPTTWVQNDIKMCGYVQHKRARQKALETFKKKEARVLVLDLLVSGHVALMAHCHSASRSPSLYVQS